MIKQLQKLLFILALCEPWIIQAQGDTISVFPFTCDFESVTDNSHWSFANSGNGWYIGTATNNTIGGTKSLYISDNAGMNNRYTNTESVSYAYLTIEVFSAGQYFLSFDWKCNGESLYDFMRVAMAPADIALPMQSSSWSASDVPVGFTAVDGGGELNMQNTWQSSSSLLLIPDAGVYNIVFVWCNDISSQNQPPAAIDNVSIVMPSCPQPTGLTANIGYNQIDFSWNPGGIEDAWMIKLNDTIVGYTNDTFYTAYNLQPNTQYNVKLYAFCGNNDTSLATESSYRTLCSYIHYLPYTVDFEGYVLGDPTSSNFISCLTRLNNGTVYFGYPYLTNSAGFNHTPFMYTGLRWFNSSEPTAYGDYQYVVMPGIDTGAFQMNRLQFRFWARSLSNIYSPVFQVGVMTNPYDINSFQVVQNINVGHNTSFSEFLVPFDAFQGSGNFIAIRAVRPVTSWEAALDDFTIEEIPDCLPVVSHHVTATASSAFVSWGINPAYTITPEEYEVSYNYASDGLANVSTDIVDSPELTLTGLDADTTYIVSVKPVCSGVAGTAHVFNFSTQALPCDDWDPVTGDCLGEATCMAPFVNAELDNNGGLHVFWLPGYNETSWNLDYHVADSASWVNALTATTLNEYTFIVDSLLPNTRYEFRITANCIDTALVATVDINVPCRLYSVPFYENFESFPTAAAAPLPGCWIKHSNESTGYPFASTSYSHSGTKSMYMYSMQTRYCYLVLPEFNIPIDSTLLSFSILRSSPVFSNNLIIGVMSDPDDFSTFVEVDNAESSSIYIWEPFEISFESYVGTGRRIAILSPIDIYSYPYIDDIVVTRLGSCQRVSNVNANNITQNSATIKWDTINANDYEVEYGPTGFALGTGSWMQVSYVDSVNLTGLTSNTVYDYYVRGVCGVDDTGSWSLIRSFRTKCELLDTLPFYEDFENYSVYNSPYISSSFIPCWKRLNNGTTRSGNPYVGGAGNNHTEGGGKGLNWTSGDGTYGDYQYIILPQFNTTLYPINTLQLTFWAKASGAVFEVGVMNDVSDTAFHRLGTVHVDDGSDWNEFTVPLSDYTGSGDYVAIRALRLASYWNANVDDITLEPIPICPRVENVRASSVLTSSAVITWTDTSNTNTVWKVEYDTVAFNPGTGHMAAIQVTDTACLITGLDSGTVYHVYVYPDCNSNIYYRSLTFSTLAFSPATLPYFCDFEADGVNGWELINGNQGNYWIVGNAVNNGGNRSMYITDNGSRHNYSNTESYVFATRVFNLAADNYICSYDWLANGTSNTDFLRVALVPENDALIPGRYSGFDNSSAVPEGSIVLDGAQCLNMQTAWQTNVEEFVVTIPGLYRMVFMWRNSTGSRNQPPAAIDNVSLQLNSCQRLLNVNAVVSSDSIIFSWFSDGSEIGWEVSIGGNTTVVTTPSYTATGLQSGSEYTVSIRTICGLGDTSRAYTELFYTTCDPVSLPYFEDFENLTTIHSTVITSVSVPCWQTMLVSLNPISSFLPTISYDDYMINSHSGYYSYHLRGKGYHLLPPMPVDLRNLQLTFWDCVTSEVDSLIVGVMEGNTFVPIQDLTNTSIRTEYIPYYYRYLMYTVNFDSYTGQSRIIAFKNYRNNSYYSDHWLDDIKVDYLPTCPIVDSLIVCTSGSDYITIDWTDNGGMAQQWEVRYGIVGGSTNTVTTFSHPFTISHLHNRRSYAVQVRPICSSTDTGSWCQEAIFSTEPCDNAIIHSTGIPNGMHCDFPIVAYIDYSLSETIIDSAELVGIGEISSIAFLYDYYIQISNKNNVAIWLQPTTKDFFSSINDFEILDTSIAVQVYHGEFNCSIGWNHFEFNTPYLWDGHNNLMVIVDDNSGSVASYGHYWAMWTFRTSSCATNKTFACNAIINDIDPTDIIDISNPYYSARIFNHRVTMKLLSCIDCDRPSLLPVTDLGFNTATLNWNGSAMNYEVSIKAFTDAAWPEATLVSGFGYVVGNLSAATTYQYRVRAVCSNDSVSAWEFGTFVTDSASCYAPTSLQNTVTTFNSATLSWTAGDRETMWEVHVWNTVFDSSFVVTSHTVTIGDLVQEMTYNAAVCALCYGGTVRSEYSDTIQFRTVNCQPVSYGSAGSITAHTAIVSWNGTAMSYDLEYGRGDFGIGTGTHVSGIAATTYTLTDLDDETAYTVYVRANCSGQQSAWHRIQFTTLVGIADVDGVNIAIYPNPATSKAIIAMSGVTGEVGITIVDLNGRTVSTNRLNCAGDCVKTIEIGDLAQGAYFVRVVGENVDIVRRLVVK